MAQATDRLLTRLEPPSMYDYDMLVIGSGPSGRRAAIQFAKLNRTVLVVEKGRRRFGAYRHYPIQDLARNRAQSFGLA
jgi:choline dehydrogenase-like flavoprotein